MVAVHTVLVHWHHFPLTMERFSVGISLVNRCLTINVDPHLYHSTNAVAASMSCQELCKLHVEQHQLVFLIGFAFPGTMFSTRAWNLPKTAEFVKACIDYNYILKVLEAGHCLMRSCHNHMSHIRPTTNNSRRNSHTTKLPRELHLCWCIPKRPKQGMMCQW